MPDHARGPTAPLRSRFLRACRIDADAIRTAAPGGRVETSLLEFRSVGPIPAWGIGVLVVAAFVATVLCTHAEYEARGTAFGFPGPAVNMLIVPFWEEVVFRGWLLGMLVRRSGRTATAIAVSSLLFGLFHIRNIPWLEPRALVRMMVFTGLVLAPVLAWTTLRCRSVWPAVLPHQLNNLAYFVRTADVFTAP